MDNALEQDEDRDWAATLEVRVLERFGSEAAMTMDPTPVSHGGVEIELTGRRAHPTLRPFATATLKGLHARFHMG
jgi:hypothetical protein